MSILSYYTPSSVGSTQPEADHVEPQAEPQSQPDHVELAQLMVETTKHTSFPLVCYCEKEIFRSIHDDQIIIQFQKLRDRRGHLPREYYVIS